MSSCTNPSGHLSRDTYELSCKTANPRATVEEHRVSEEFQNHIETEEMEFVYIVPNDDLQVEFSDGVIPQDC